MTHIDLTNLETIAKNATQGPWEINSATCGSEVGDYTVYGIPGVATADWATDSASAFAYCEGMELNDATHIAAFDPPTVLALIAWLKKAEDTITRVEDLAKHWAETGNGHYRDLNNALETP